MAIISAPADFAEPQTTTDFAIGPKTAEALMYIVIAILAIAIAVPAAIATSNAPLFEECYAGCAAQ